MVQRDGATQKIPARANTVDCFTNVEIRQGADSVESLNNNAELEVHIGGLPRPVPAGGATKNNRDGQMSIILNSITLLHDR